MTERGHNERSFRLDALASEAREGLQRVEAGEENTIGGWLAFGHALNEGRAMHDGDREFGQWLSSSNLDKHNGRDVHPGDQQAAMWAAANADQFEEARQRGNPRTIRGTHAKWREIKAEREAERLAEEQRQKAEAEAQSHKVSADKAAEEAQQMAAEEQAAREAAKAAKSDEEREAAKAALADAINARKEAEQEAKKASTAMMADPAPDRSRTGSGSESDPHAKMRAEFRAMTPEAQEDDWIGLREEIMQLRQRVKSQTSQIADLKQAVHDLSNGSDLGAKLSAKVRELGAVKLTRDDALTAAKRMEYRMKKAEAERDEVRTKLENQVLTL